MNLEEIRGIARSCGIKPDKLGKIDMIRTIQRNEGNFDCFATAFDGVCDQTACLWRKDCLSLARKSLAA